jgi:pimeloyl-ACP methyl ester carboxylesterase
MGEIRTIGRKGSVTGGILETHDGAHLYLEQAGAGRAVLLVHGWTMSGRFWARQIEPLAMHFKVVTVDLRGHGNSSKVLHGHTLVQYAQDLHLVVDSLHLQDVTLVGWSLAGPVLLEYWNRYGGKGVSALCLVEMTPFPFSPENWNTHRLANYQLRGMNEALNNLQTDRVAFGRQFIDSMFLVGKAPEKDMQWMLPEHLATPTPIATAIYSDYLMRDYSQSLHGISVPVLVANGNSSHICFGPNTGRHVADTLPNGKLEIFNNSGHMPFYEEPERFNAGLLEWLKQSGGRR